MEPVSEGCPTGILIDIGLQTKASNNMNGIEKNQVSIKNIKKKNIVADTRASHPWSSDCYLDLSPLRHQPILQRNRFVTPKSKWKTPSPRSMKIISHEASRIVDQLYSSPINLSEVMICDEVFPTVKSLDNCLDEYHIKSNILPEMNITCTHGKIDQSNPNLLDFEKCSISAISKPESEVTSDEKHSTIKMQSDMKPAIEHDSVSGKSIESTPKNAPIKESNTELFVTDIAMVKSVTYVVDSSNVIPECTNVSSGKLLASKHEVTKLKTMPADAKGFGFKMSLKHYSDENVLQSDETRQEKYGRKFSKTEKSCNSMDDESKETKISENQIVRKESVVSQSSKKNIATKYPGLERKKGKENQILEDHLSKTMIGKPKGLLQNKTAVRSQSLLYKKDPLCKTGPLLGTPIVASSIRRNSSFHAGSSRNIFPAVEKTVIPTTDSCSRILKPKTPLNQVLNNGNKYSTPLQFERYSKTFKPADSTSANPMRKKSLGLNSNYSLVVSDIKVSQSNQHSVTKKPAITSSNRLRFVKKLNASSHPKFKNDCLSRKLFP